MYISKKLRARINAAVQPYYITTNYLGSDLEKLLILYSKYFARCRYHIRHFQPKYKLCGDLSLVILFNAFKKKYGYDNGIRPINWVFYGNILLTKYGYKKQRKEQKLLRRKRKRERKRRQKEQSTRHNQTKKSVDDASNETHKKAEKNGVIILEPSLSNRREQDPEKTLKNHADGKPTNENENDTLTAELSKENTTADTDTNTNEKVDEFDDETVDNIWNLDIQEVAALITESGNDEKQLTDEAADEDVSEESLSNSNHHEEMHGDIGVSDGDTANFSGVSDDINEKIRQQLALLKKGKCENTLFTSKKTSSLADTRSTPTSAFRRSNSNTLDESKKVSGFLDAKSSKNESHCDADKSNADVNAAQQKCKEQMQKSKSNGGIIDSLFNKLQSIGKVIPVRLKPKTTVSVEYTAPNEPTAQPPPPPSIPAKRFRRDERPMTDNALFSTFDLNHDDSNQSANSVAVEFLGFDIANKNVDVSALLPTPKAMTSNEQAAFVSEYLDTFMKENYLENVNVDIAIKPKPKRYNADEALMTTDAQPPNLSVPERPMDMQRPRTLAEKRMILQQHNDISLLIIENESTVYHELKKRVKQGASYDNSLMRSIQDANIPFTRDCWRAACWISTSNNRFFYRTILYDDTEIKLVGSRGDNEDKVAIKLSLDDKKPYISEIKKRTLADCPKRCPSIEGIRINNIDAILDDGKIKTEYDFGSKQKYGILKKSRLCMFSREYLTPGPKCKKIQCKSNRKSSFDLEYGPLELVQLPTVQLEVWPQVGIPLPDHIKPILKTIPANSNVITAEWAKFAVSVVRESPKQVKHRRKYKKPEIEKPQSIVFNIPYENHEKMILIRRRRRSAIVFNENDTKHEQIESFYLNDGDNSNQLTFAEHVDPSDTFSMECASILSNIIDSVAIAVNDTNFIKRDPDIDYVGKIVPIAGGSKDSTKNSGKCEKDKQTVKNEKPAKSKLMKELKRLNVTVIDTANELAKCKKSDEICQKQFCKLGCICESIDNAKHIRMHCQRYECMFSCTCTNTPFCETNPFYLNNSIDLLQARANARLAKEEKEFKSTIIVSENDTFVLPSSSTATKRSSKKPKRFTNDESCVEDTETETIFKSKRRRQAEKVTTPSEHRPIEIQQRCNLLKSLQHVRVELKSLPDLGVEPWCMVHCLYKCHCKGRAQKGRIFNFANKKNDMTGPGGWELISPRKRQYTFERDSNLYIDEPMPKCRKQSLLSNVLDEDVEEWCLVAARTSLFNWKNRPRRSAHELKMFRNECMFNERKRSELLEQRIAKCRKYTHAENILTKSMENGRLVSLAHTKPDDTSTESLKSVDKPTNLALERLNQVITHTMHRLTALQERNKLSLNPTPNKLSIVPWDRMVQAFRVSDVYIWDITLKNNLRLLALTTTFTRPTSEHYLQVININYADKNSLPMVGKLLREAFQTEKTKYLAMVLLRITHFWQICGVIHSDLKYMDDELRAKPTPDKNPLLGRKINKLYRLLTSRETPTNNPSISNTQSQSPNASASPSLAITNCKTANEKDSKNDRKLNHAQNERIEEGNGSVSNMASMASMASMANVANGDDDDDDDENMDDVSEVQLDESTTYFENISMRLFLPIPVTMNQRLLMLNVGDDFTHVWFSTWRKFLSMKRIKNSFVLAKMKGKAFELSQRKRNPKVFVSHLHDNCIFIGPYGNTDRQNLGLFVKHEDHMWLSDIYYKEFNTTYSKKTKASWVYPSRPRNKQTITLKIDQVYSKDTLPSELNDSNTTSPSISANESNEASTNGHFAAVSASNGIRTESNVSDVPVVTTNLRGSVSKTTSVPVPASKVYVPTKIVEIRPFNKKVWNENQVMQNSSNNTNSMPLKISSVVSGDRVALMTNGLPITADELADEMNENTDDGSNPQLEICEPNSSAGDEQQSNASRPKIDEPNDNACDPMTCKPNKYGDILISTKTEPIDISDDDDDNDNEQNDFHITSDINPLISSQTENVENFQISGYIYCTTNVQLGKVNLEYRSPNTIKLYLKEPVEIHPYEGWQMQKRQPNLTSVTRYMQSYIKRNFYGIYPAQLRFDWIFISSEQFDQDAITLCDFNSLDPQSVVFKDKVVPLNSNYRDDAKLHKKEIFVVDIYQLASQLFPEEEQQEVKTMKIADIIAKSKQIDAKLIERQRKLKKTIANCQKFIRRQRMNNQIQNS